MNSAKRFRTIRRELVEQIMQPWLLSVGVIQEGETIVFENLPLDLGMYIQPEKSLDDFKGVYRVNGKKVQAGL